MCRGTGDRERDGYLSRKWGQACIVMKRKVLAALDSNAAAALELCWWQRPTRVFKPSYADSLAPLLPQDFDLREGSPENPWYQYFDVTLEPLQVCSGSHMLGAGGQGGNGAGGEGTGSKEAGSEVNGVAEG